MRTIRISLLLCYLLLTALVSPAQCPASFSPTAYNDSLHFQNTSNNPAARYYWNFGDGDGSNDPNPSHIYPDDGVYNVTLYLQDTLTGCTDAFTTALQVTKPDTFPCFLDGSYLVTQAGATTFLSTVNNTSNCPPFTFIDCDAGPGLNGAWSIIVDPSWGEGLWLSRMQVLDTTNAGYGILGEFYQTVEIGYDPAENYEDCSANFEVVLDYQSGFCTAQFRAMNRNASAYNWEITGFGIPIIYTSADASHNYPYTPNEKAFPWTVTLRTTDNANNCADTVTQQILVQNPNYQPLVGTASASAPISLHAYPNPASSQCWLETGASPQQPAAIRVYNHSGQVLREFIQTESRTALDMADWPAGMYMVEARQGALRNTRKILLMR